MFNPSAATNEVLVPISVENPRLFAIWQGCSAVLKILGCRSLHCFTPMRLPIVEESVEIDWRDRGSDDCENSLKTVHKRSSLLHFQIIVSVFRIYIYSSMVSDSRRHSKGAVQSLCTWMIRIIGGAKRPTRLGSTAWAHHCLRTCISASLTNQCPLISGSFLGRTHRCGERLLDCLK